MRVASPESSRPVLPRRRSFAFAGLASLLVAWFASGSTASARDEVRDDGGWRLAPFATSLLADSDVTWHVRREAAAPAGARLDWSVTANQRTVARGQATWQAGDAESSVALIKWTAPSVKDEVIVPVQCHLSLVAGERTIAATSRAAWIFPRDPFATRRAWLQSLDLVLIASDVETRRELETAGVPHRAISGATAVDRLRREILIVSDRASPAERRAPAAAIEAFVRRGGRCLWIAPSPGTRLFAADSEGGEEREGAERPTWERLNLRRRGVVLEFDKRLDPDTWREATSGTTSLRIASRRGAGGASTQFWEASDARDGWPWLDAATSDGGRLIACGFPLLNDWNQGATPRYLFARILQSLAESESPATSPASDSP